MLYGAPYSSVYLKAFFAAKLIGEDKAAPPMDPVVMGSYHGRDPEKRYHASSGEKEKLLKELFGNGRHLPEYNTFSLLLVLFLCCPPPVSHVPFFRFARLDGADSFAIRRDS